MAKPLKVFSNSTQEPTRKKISADAFLLLPSGTSLARSEPTVPDWAIEIVLSELVKRTRMANAHSAARELLFFTKLALRIENGPIKTPGVSPETLLPALVRQFLHSPRRKRVHPQCVIQLQVTQLLPLLKPYKECKSYTARSRWIAKHAPETLNQLAKIHGCSATCPAKTQAPDGATIQDWASYPGSAALRDRLLAHYHGVHEDRIRQIWN